MTKGKPLANSDPKEFARDWNSYVSNQEIAEKYGVHASSVGVHAKKLGLRQRGRSRKKDDDNRE